MTRSPKGPSDGDPRQEDRRTEYDRRTDKRHPGSRQGRPREWPPRGARRDAAPQQRLSERADALVLYGWHPVSEALRNPARRHLKLLATENSARRLAEEIGALPIEPELVRVDAISRLVGPDAVHQGLYLESEPLKAPALDALPSGTLLLALDQITDPHNVGAILRSAAAFGVDAIVSPARHSASATGVLAKAASGGLEHVPFITVRNLAEALIEMGEAGVQRIGLDSEGPVRLGDVKVQRPAVLVLGAEGKGLRSRTRDCCDVIVRLDLPGAIKSLNVSNAAAIALYQLTQEGD